jgi:hypothetical protein
MDREFLHAALVLAHSLRHMNNTPGSISVLIMPDPATIRLNFEAVVLLDIVRSVFDLIVHRPVFAMEGRPPIFEQEPLFLYKLWAFELEDHCERVVWLGADTLAVGPLQNAMACEPVPCGVPDMWLWGFYQFAPAMNGDIIVVEPSRWLFHELVRSYNETPTALLNDWEQGGPFDQGAINRYYKGNMTMLPWFYNVQIKAVAVDPPLRRVPDAFKESKDMWKILHFANIKPWDLNYRALNDTTWMHAFALWDRACESLQRSVPYASLLRHCPQPPTPPPQIEQSDAPVS